MNHTTHRQCRGPITSVAATVLLCAGLGAPLFAQEAPADRRESGYVGRGCTIEERDINADCRREPAPEEQKSPREAAPIDLTGHWVSIVSEEWRWRMITPPKGDVASMPLNAEARKVADAWDPQKDGTCKVWGAAGMIRNPMRVRFTWEGDHALKMETDHGTVTRLFHFDASKAPSGAPSMQGSSVASWDDGGLKVVTTQLAPGYLRKNGVPYSDKTTLTEYYNRYSALGEDYITVMTVVHDPTYLTREFITTTDFKRLKSGDDWNPTPCTDGGGTAATAQASAR